MAEQQQYDKPAHFVNVKRVRTGEKDQKGRDKTTLTFGLGTTRDGVAVNNLDTLINTLEQYRGKQVNLSIYVEEKTTPQGRTFPSAFVRITEMVPKDQAQGQTQFVPKNQTRNESVKEKAAEINKRFNSGS